MRPGKVVRHDASGVLPAIETTRAAVERLRAVIVAVAIVNLALVALRELARDRAEEDA
jgi:hypothetical protein